MARYIQLDNGENDGKNENENDTRWAQPVATKTSQIRLVVLGFLSGLLLTMAAAFCLQTRGRLTVDSTGSLLAPPGSLSRQFYPEASFELGSSESNQAWRSIIPEGMGFVQTPDTGPEIIGLAFVHQIHCLDILRNSYAAAIANKTTAETTRHTGHCFEYLRQSIMCNADANIEYRHYNDTLDRLETTGWDKKQCRDFSALFDFAEHWRVYSGKTPHERTRLEMDKLGRVLHYDFVSTRGDLTPLD